MPYNRIRQQYQELSGDVIRLVVPGAPRRRRAGRARPRREAADRAWGRGVPGARHMESQPGDASARGAGPGMTAFACKLFCVWSLA